MKHLLPLASALLLLLSACQSNPATPVAEVATPAPAPAPAKPQPATPEHIEASMLTIADLPAGEVTTKQLLRQLGHPDSIAKGAVECGSRLATPTGSPDGDFWYYGKTLYEVSGTQAIWCSFDVTSGKFQGKLGKLVLNQNTTLEDVRRYFPVAAHAADQPSTSRPGEEEMSLTFYEKGVPMDGSLILLFKHGRLQAVEYFTPC